MVQSKQTRYWILVTRHWIPGAGEDHVRRKNALLVAGCSMLVNYIEKKV